MSRLTKRTNSSLSRDSDGYYGVKREVSWSKGRRTVTVTRPDRNRNLISETRVTNFGGIFGIIALVLLLAALFSFLVGHGEPKTFYSFLVMLRDVPEVISSDDVMSLFTLGSWTANLPDWLSWSEGFFNFISSIITIFGFIIKGMTDAALFIFYFVRWLFI